MTFVPPTSPLGLLAGISILPIVLLFALVFVTRVFYAAVAALAATILVACVLYGMPADFAFLSAVNGALFGAWPICQIVLSAIFLYDVCVTSGHFDAVRYTLASLTKDRRATALLLAYCFSGLMEGASGFATPIVLATSMMVGLGFRRSDAIKAALIGNTVPVPFGGLGVPTVTLAALVKIDPVILARATSRLMVPFTFIVPWAVVYSVSPSVKSALEMWPACITVSVVQCGVSLLIAHYTGPQVPSILSMLCALAALAILLLKVWQPPTILLPVNVIESPDQTPAAAQAGPDGGKEAPAAATAPPLAPPLASPASGDPSSQTPPHPQVMVEAGSPLSPLAVLSDGVVSPSEAAYKSPLASPQGPEGPSSPELGAALQQASPLSSPNLQQQSSSPAPAEAFALPPPSSTSPRIVSSPGGGARSGSSSSASVAPAPMLDVGARQVSVGGDDDDDEDGNNQANASSHHQHRPAPTSDAVAAAIIKARASSSSSLTPGASGASAPAPASPTLGAQQAQQQQQSDTFLKRTQSSAAMWLSQPVSTHVVRMRPVTLHEVGSMRIDASNAATAYFPHRQEGSAPAAGTSVSFGTAVPRAVTLRQQQGAASAQFAGDARAGDQVEVPLSAAEVQRRREMEEEAAKRSADTLSAAAGKLAELEQQSIHGGSTQVVVHSAPAEAAAPSSAAPQESGPSSSSSDPAPAPAKKPVDDGHGGSGPAPLVVHHYDTLHPPTRKEVLEGWAPWLFACAAVGAWGSPPVKAALNVATVKAIFHDLDHQVVKAGVPMSAYWTVDLLGATGTCLIIVALLTSAGYGLPPKLVATIFFRSIKRMALSFATIMMLLSFGYVLRFSGQDMAIGLAAAESSTAFPVLSAFIGFLGVALTGSATSANVIFGGTQVAAANALGLNPVHMAAANTVSGGLGHVISASTILVASVAAGESGKDIVKVARIVGGYALLFFVLMAAWNMIVAYAIPSYIPQLDEAV